MLSGGDILALWEQAAGLDPPRQALALAAATDGEQDVAALPVGQRDARLLRLRASVAGPTLEATALCVACEERVEFSIDTLELLQVGAPRSGPQTLAVEGLLVTWRLPTGDDLADLTALADPARAAAELFERCILEVSAAEPMTASQPMTASDLPAEVRVAITDAMAEADPLAEILVDLTCAHCGSPFMAEVDAAEATWMELNASARRLLREIDLLARVYGWTERAVLELSDWRRAAYVELAIGS